MTNFQSNRSLRKKYSPVIIYGEITAPPSTHLLVNKYSHLEISTPLEVVWSVVFSHLNTPGSSIFLGNMCSLMKLLYINKRKQQLEGVV